MRTSMPAVWGRGQLSVSVSVSGTGVKGSYPDARVRGILDGLEEVVVHGVETHGEGAVDDPPVDVDAKVDLHEVLVLEDDVLLAGIGRVMGNLVVEAEAGGETHASLEAVAGLKALVVEHRPDAVLNALGDTEEGLAGLHRLLHPASGLAMNLGGLAVVPEPVLVLGEPASLVTAFGGRHRCLGVELDLTLGELAGREEVIDQDGRRGRLLEG